MKVILCKVNHHTPQVKLQDQLAFSYFSSYNLPITIVRPFNTFGPRQSSRAIIPTIITQIASGKKELNLGSLTPTRDFNYVKDLVNGYEIIMKSSSGYGEVVNIDLDTKYQFRFGKSYC